MVENFSKKIGNLEQQRDVFTYRHFQKLRAICNNEQKIKFDSIIQQALHQMAPAKGRRSGPGQEGMRPGDDDRPPPPGMRRGDGPPPPGMRPEGPPKKDSM